MSATIEKRKPVRIWVDGCFDLMHFGHFNALRQAKAMGDYLVVGVHSDAEIEKNKGPTVMKEDERYAAVAACKWVDEVVPNAPYLTSLEWMDRYNCDFCVHGDDITTMADGTDCYQVVKDAGRYRECKRTQDISTTELVGRMLLMTKDHHKRRGSVTASSISSVNTAELGTFSTGGSKTKPDTKISHFLPTSRKIVQFSEGREPQPGDKVVYVDGTFDLFHTVVIGAPYSVSDQVLEKVYKVDLVVHGNTPSLNDTNGEDPYKIAKERNIYVEIDNPQNSVTTESIIERIITHRKIFEERQRRKAEKAILEREAELAEKAAAAAAASAQQ
ncbi:Ethanolamine-phosphate cytidylyltransferase [Lobosporangium transversale]|nr:Ethanolamine-phosphate cytidylyltransferase [Lobosporangium transversale]